MTIVKKYFGEITTGTLDEWQKKNDIQLPEEYRGFLLKNNGVILKPSIFKISDSQGESSISAFYGVADGDQFGHLDLEENLLSTRSDMPGDMLPLGQDPGGNYICMCIKGANYGKIYFWDHEQHNEDENGDPNYDNLFLIADSFADFLTGLK